MSLTLTGRPLPEGERSSLWTTFAETMVEVSIETSGSALTTFPPPSATPGARNRKVCQGRALHHRVVEVQAELRVQQNQGDHNIIDIVLDHGHITP